MRYLRSTLVVIVTTTALSISGCNSNFARYSDPSESLVAGKYGSFSQRADLWDRVRSGMWLEIPDNPRVDRFVRWYKEHPAILDRMQQNAELYLYHIVFFYIQIIQQILGGLKLWRVIAEKSD